MPVSTTLERFAAKYKVEASLAGVLTDERIVHARPSPTLCDQVCNAVLVKFLNAPHFAIGGNQSVKLRIVLGLTTFLEQRLHSRAGRLSVLAVPKDVVVYWVCNGCGALLLDHERDEGIVPSKALI